MTAGTLPGVGSASSAPTIETLTPQRCSINTATLGYREPIERVIDRIAERGFGGIAPWRRDLDGRSVLGIGRRIRDAGLRVSGLCRSSYLPGRTRREREAALEDNRRAIEQAAELNAACFVMVVGGLATGSKDLAAARNQVEEGLAALLEHGRSVGVPLAIEPLHPMYAADRSCVTGLNEALALCERLDPAGRGGVGVAIDAYHVWWDWQLSAAVATAGARNAILAFHICDWLVPTRDLLLDRGLMGDGVIALPELRKRVREAGFAGLVEVEIFSRELWELDPDDILARCAARVESVC